MDKSSKKPKSGKKKVELKDLKAKDAGKIKGGETVSKRPGRVKY